MPAFNIGSFLGNLLGNVQRNPVVQEIEVLAPQIAAAVAAGGGSIPAFTINVGNQKVSLGPIPVSILPK